MEFLDSIIGAAIALSGFLVGRRMKPGAIPAPRRKMTCESCNHGRGYHEDDKGCTYERYPVNIVEESRGICSCRKYTGPKTEEEELTERENRLGL